MKFCKTKLHLDMLISRKDNAINMCEIKFYSDDFVVTKEYFRTMQRRIEMLRTKISPKMSIYSTLITTYGNSNIQYRISFFEEKLSL